MIAEELERPSGAADEASRQANRSLWVRQCPSECLIRAENVQLTRLSTTNNH